MSETSERCKNYGKHDGTSHYWLCRRCKEGLIESCNYFELKSEDKK